MKLPLYQIDAFTDHVFGGNPAAVVVLERWLPDAVLAAIAAENNLAETAFVIPGQGACPLRWFTPKAEIDLCGHATLATADVLFRAYFPERQQLVFSTLSGDLTVTRARRAEADCLSMDFPARPGVPDRSDALVAALGAVPQAVLRARDWMAVFATEAEVRALKPDFRALAALDTVGMIATAPGESVDFVSRFFAPRMGIDEDPVTGSAHCTLVPYWSERLGKRTLVARQVSARGGTLWCEQEGARVRMSGQAVQYLRGEIEIDADERA